MNSIHLINGLITSFGIIILCKTAYWNKKTFVIRGRSEKMKPEEMLKYATEYDISERELNWLKSPYQRIEHVTKFEFQQIFHNRLSIEKSPFSNEDEWVIKDFGMYFYNYYEGEFDIRTKITKENLSNFQRSLKHAFDFAKRLQKKEQERKIFYIGRCEWCDKYIGEENLLEAFGRKICKECSDKID